MKPTVMTAEYMRNRSPIQDKLIVEHLYLIPKVVNGLRFPKYADFDNLKGEGHVGLIKAAVSWDPQKTPAFKDWARWHIKNAVIDSLRRRSLYEQTGGTVHLLKFPCREESPSIDMELKEEAQKILDRFPPRISKILKLYYLKHMMKQDIAKKLKVSPSRITQLLALV